MRPLADQGVLIGCIDLNPDAAGGAAVVVDFQDGVAEGAVPARRFLVQGFLLLICAVIATARGEFLALLWEIPGDQSFAQLVAGMAIAKNRLVEIGVEPAINLPEGSKRRRA